MAILYKIHDSLIAGHPGKENTFALLVKDFVTGLGLGYIIPGPWPEPTPLALWFRQEPPFIIVNSGVRLS